MQPIAVQEPQEPLGSAAHPVSSMSAHFGDSSALLQVESLADCLVVVDVPNHHFTFGAATGEEQVRVRAESTTEEVALRSEAGLPGWRTLW